MYISYYVYILIRLCTVHIKVYHSVHSFLQGGNHSGHAVSGEEPHSCEVLPHWRSL